MLHLFLLLRLDWTLILEEKKRRKIMTKFAWAVQAQSGHAHLGVFVASHSHFNSSTL